MINLLYLIYKILINQDRIGYLFQETITIFLYLIHLELDIYLKIFMKYIKIYIIISYIYRIQQINSNLCGLFSILSCLYKVNKKINL